MKQSLIGLLVWTAVAAAASVDAQTLTSGPSTNTVVTPASDYASTQWQDPWDMKQRTDLGWFTWGVDQPANSMTSKGMNAYPGSPSSGCGNGGAGSSDCYTFSYTSGAYPNWPKFFLLDSWVPGSTLSGKVGALRPIDTTKYKYLLIKIRFGNSNNKLSGEWSQDFSGPPQAQIIWSRDTIYTGYPNHPNGGLQEIVTNSYQGVTLAGWVGEDDLASHNYNSEGADANQWYIFGIRLDQASWYNSSNTSYTSAAAPWGQPGVTADSLAIGPIVNAAATNPGTTEVDWVQLTDVPAMQTITWTGGTADIVISQQADCGNYTVIGKSRSSGFQFPFGSLPAGSYHVGLRAARNDGDGSSIPAISAGNCSTGAYVVPDPATLTFTTPTDIGSTDDFATVFLQNPWDFATTSDFERTGGMTGATIETIHAQRPDGTDLGSSVRVFDATSTQVACNPTCPPGDPFGYLLDFMGRGLYNRIDPNRYRIVTVDMGINAQRDLAHGSIGRVIWHVAGDQDLYNGNERFLENVSEDIPIRSLFTSNPTSVPYVLDRLQFDMKDRGTLDLESDPDLPPPNETSPSRSGWTASSCTSTPQYCDAKGAAAQKAYPGVDGFRFDPHEFSSPTEFYIAQVRLAALEQTGTTYTLQWTATLPGTSGLSAKVYLYANPAVTTVTNRNPANTGVSLSAFSPTCDETALASYRINSSSGTAISSGAGSYAWNVSASSLPDNTEYYICGVVHGTINNTDMVLATTRTQFPIEVNTGYQAKPRLFMNRSVLYFDVIYDVTQNSFTPGPPQTVAVAQAGAGTARWALGVTDSNGNVTDSNGNPINSIGLDTASGSGSGRFTVSVTPILNGGKWNLPSCTAETGLALVLKLTSMGTADDDPQYMQIFVTIRPKAGTSCANGLNTAPSAPPFGYMELPTDNSTQQGAFAITGWALDDIGIARVIIMRNCTFVDQAQSPSPCGGFIPNDPTQYVYIGDAERVPDARPDVQAVYPNYPESYLAGWGYLALSNFLPHLTAPTSPQGGQGQFTFYSFAVDVEGNYTRLGSRTINADNDHATQPFGAIDTPAQGGQVPDPSASGYTDPNAYPNFGWAMTQNPKCIDVTSPTNYGVYIDGVPRPLNGQNWTAGLDRPDLPAAFPGLCNSDNAAARYVLDVSALGLTDGLHTILWTATDNGNPPNLGAFGSRYFSVFGGGVTQGQEAAPQVAAVTSPVGRDIGRPAQAFALTPVASGTVEARALGATTSDTFAAGASGDSDVIHVAPVRQVAIDLPHTPGASPWMAYLVREDRLSLLPIGSTFDPATARLSWAPIPGSSGTFSFLFIRRGADGRQEKLPLHVIVGTPSGSASGAPNEPRDR